MVVLWGGAVSYERGIPVGVPPVSRLPPVETHTLQGPASQSNRVPHCDTGPRWCILLCYGLTPNTVELIPALGALCQVDLPPSDLIGFGLHMDLLHVQVLVTCARARKLCEGS